MSIHKSQGQTLERVKVDLGKIFEKGASLSTCCFDLVLTPGQARHMLPSLEPRPWPVYKYSTLIPRRYVPFYVLSVNWTLIRLCGTRYKPTPKSWHGARSCRLSRNPARRRSECARCEGTHIILCVLAIIIALIIPTASRPINAVCVFPPVVKE